MSLVWLKLSITFEIRRLQGCKIPATQHAPFFSSIIIVLITRTCSADLTTDYQVQYRYQIKQNYEKRGKFSIAGNITGMLKGSRLGDLGWRARDP